MKTPRLWWSAVSFGVVATTIVLSVGLASSEETEQTGTRASMRGLFVVLSSVYRYSLDADAFADTKNHKEIQSKLEALAKNADQLEAHGGSTLDPSFEFMRRSLSRDAHEALEAYTSANYVGARFVLSDITENCVTCHTKLPATRPFEAGKEFLDAINANDFPPTSRAKLQVATRQFADAMKTYEDVLRSERISAADLAVFDVFDNYLSVSVGALNDTHRPVPVLEAFARRPDVPDAVKRDAEAWIASLKSLNLDATKGKELAAARGLVENAMKASASPSDRSHLVDYIASITLVHRSLRSAPQDNETTAEAYYLLGVAESHVSRSYWVSETEHLLDRSIRLAPKSKTAKQALAYLEQYRRSSAHVTPARVVPKEHQVNIDELRKLTES
ncbi:MAG TPA: hypothetical protein VFU38_00445 [Candidatus Krumholzibacteria bacterium]|nr:hypothetical protein [Candidatus Krumholzibacteria bacterium]